MDPKMTFDEAKTHLSLQTQRENYIVRMDTYSRTSRSATVRQELSLVFCDGILIGRAYDREKEVDTLIQQWKQQNQSSHLYQVITLHHAEFHRENKTATGQQILTGDRLYISASRQKSARAFRTPDTPEEIKIKKILDDHLQHQLQFEWRMAMKKFEIDPKQFYLIPLTQLHEYTHDEPLPGLVSDQSYVVLGMLWEGLSRHYDANLEDAKEENTRTSGSSVPLLLIEKNGHSIKVLYRTREGLYHQLSQNVPDSR